MEQFKAWVLVCGCAAFAVIGGFVLWTWLNSVALGLFIGGLVLLWIITRFGDRVMAWVRIVIFLIVIMLPLAGLVFGFSDTDEEFARVEKRMRAAFAKEDLSPLQKAPDKIEAGFNDHFGFRGKMINLYADFMYKIFGKSINPDKVVIGKDGFLFLGNSFARIIYMTQDRVDFDGDRISRWGDIMLDRKNFLSSKGVDFYVVIAPNKHSVYPDKLPSNIPSTQKTFYDKMYAEYTAKGINFIPLRDVLRGARERYGDDLFIKSDSHWSSLGACLATVATINRIAEVYPQLKIPQAAGFTRKDHYPGDLLGMARSPSYPFSYQTILNWKPEASSLLFQFIDNREANKVYTVGSTQEIPDFAKVRVINKSVKNKLKVLVLKDSFIMAMSPFINNTFHETIYYNCTDPEHYGLSRLIERHKPDIVIFEVVERDMLRSDLIKL